MGAFYCIIWQESKKKFQGEKKFKNEKYIATEFSSNITGMWSPLNIHTDDLFGIFIHSYEEKENVIPSEANFHLLWNSHLNISENTLPSLDITYYSSGSRLMSATFWDTWKQIPNHISDKSPRSLVGCHHPISSISPVKMQERFSLLLPSMCNSR